MPYTLISPANKSDHAVYTALASEGASRKADVLGGKGFNLVLMSREMKLPVPPGFIIPTRYSHGADDDTTINAHASTIDLFMKAVEVQAGRSFGDAKNPLLLSVRSGAPVSMPGMMDTILNVGLTAANVKGLAATTNPDFAWDSYRRLVVMYASTVCGADVEPLNEAYADAREFAKLPERALLPAALAEKLIASYKSTLGDAFVPQDVAQQLHECIKAVWRSWNSERAKTYRDLENIPHDLGTAVTVQTMVFGNLNDQSGTGVAFTRNPNTGEDVRFGDFLVAAQGEDVVDGSSKTLPLSNMASVFPDAAAELEKAMDRIVKHYKGDLCDIEFTVEDGKLYMLQARIGKRSAAANVAITLDRHAKSYITTAEATEILMAAVQNAQNATGTGDALDGSDLTCVATGLGAVPGVVVGRAAFTAKKAVAAAKKGPVILIRKETSPDDVAGMKAAAGILTATGGLVSHAAVVARGWDKPCVVGADKMVVSSSMAMIGNKSIKPGDLVKIDGTTGQIYI